MSALTFGLPAVTIDEFFGENLINNLALFLDIPSENILIANAVTESRRRRKKRSNEITEITIQIANQPGNTTNSTMGLSTEVLTNVSSTLVNAVQLNMLEGVLNVTIVTVDMSEAVPSPGDEAWAEVISDLRGSPSWHCTTSCKA